MSIPRTDPFTNTKYFNFGDGADFAAPLTGITGFTVTPSAGASVVTGLALTSANDQPERDPASYKLEGSNDGTTFQLISQGSVGAFSGRFIRQTIAFANAAPYTSYKLTFPTVVNAAAAIAMQIAEVELLGTIVGGPSAAQISISQANGMITIQFTGTLHSASQVTGPYSPVMGATNPFAVAPNDAARFYIAR